MSVRVSASCWKVPLPPTDKMVLMRLADFADDHGHNIWPAVQTVADDTGYSVRAVQVALRKLCDSEILILVNPGGGRRRTAEYAIDLDRLEQLRRPEPEARHHASGYRGNGANGANPAGAAPFPNPANGEKGAAHAQNPAGAAPNPLGTVNTEEGETVCVDATPCAPAREADTHTGPRSPDRSGNVVELCRTSGATLPAREVRALPAGWVPSDDQRRLAIDLGHPDVDGAALRFREHWTTKADNGERGAAKSAVAWADAWEWWVRQDVRNAAQRNRGHGRQHHAAPATGANATARIFAEVFGRGT